MLSKNDQLGRLKLSSSHGAGAETSSPIATGTRRVSTEAEIDAQLAGTGTERVDTNVRRLDRLCYGALLSAFLLSRSLFYFCGLRFDLRPLATSWHVLDPALLQHKLLESLVYMHGQPPLYNLFLGLVLKLAGSVEASRPYFAVLYALISLATTLLMFSLLRTAHVLRGLAMSATLLFMLSPGLLLYESLPYYTVWVVFLLTLSTWLFQRLMLAFSTARAHALFGVLTLLIYSRSLFQLPWFLMLFGATWLLARRSGTGRRVVYAAILPFCLVLGVYVKNGLLVDSWSTSSWFGMSVVKLTVHPLPDALRQELWRAGELSESGKDRVTFGAPEEYGDFFAHVPKTGVEVLDTPYKSTGHVNYNHLGYVLLSKRAVRDAAAGVSHAPWSYARTAAMALVMFWRPSSDYKFLLPNRDSIEGLSRFYGRFVAWQPYYARVPHFRLESGQVGFALMATHLLSLGYGALLCVRALRERRLSAAQATAIFAWLSVLYVTSVGTLCEFGENHRFRFYIVPLMSLLLCSAANEFAAWVRSYGSRSAMPQEDQRDAAIDQTGERRSVTRA